MKHGTPKQLAYKREWMRNYRANKKPAKLIASGHCPICDMLLDSVYHTPIQSMLTFGYVCQYFSSSRGDALGANDSPKVV